MLDNGRVLFHRHLGHFVFTGEFMKHTNLILLLALILSACTSLSTPTEIPPPSKTSTPFPASTIPIPTQKVVRVVTINDIAVIEPEVSLQNGNIVMRICYIWSGEGVWELGPSAVKFANGSSTSYTSEEISLEPMAGPQPGFIRCIKQTYSQIPETADLSQINAEIQSIHLLPSPDPGDECKIYQERLTNSFEIESLKIEAVCNQEDNAVTFSILKKPDNMNTKQALLYLNRISGYIEGPWIFTVSIK